MILLNFMIFFDIDSSEKLEKVPLNCVLFEGGKHSNIKIN